MLFLHSFPLTQCLSQWLSVTHATLRVDPIPSHFISSDASLPHPACLTINGRFLEPQAELLLAELNRSMPPRFERLNHSIAQLVC